MSLDLSVKPEFYQLSMVIVVYGNRTKRRRVFVTTIHRANLRLFLKHTINVEVISQG